MISRLHAKLQLRESPTGAAWFIVDQSMNGVLVNGEKIEAGGAGHLLASRDLITFGRKVTPPEFEFVLELPSGEDSEPTDEARAAQDKLEEQLRKVAALEEELKKEREEKILASQKAKAEREAERRSAGLEVSELSNELTCSICKDWSVHPAVVECSHSFCWFCIDHWLHQKNFVCPQCRHPVNREPVRNMALDNLIQKAMEKLPSDQSAEYDERVKKAEEQLKKAEKNNQELARSIREAQAKGKNFFHIDGCWSKKERDVFQRGIKDYSGNTRETYCKLTGLTVQWVHSADDFKLNRALHNLQLQKFVDKSSAEIQTRLLMFLRYG